jgi:toxin-antitoxin system PIN domain toxin
MISVDTNLLLAALVASHEMNAPASCFIRDLSEREDVAISEFVLLELYGLLRNPAVMTKPLSAPLAVKTCQSFRNHPRWRLVGFTAGSRGLHDQLWVNAGTPDLPRRRIYDLRLALTLLKHGVTEFATVNVKDFQNMGFEKVWDPLKPGH